MKKNRRGAVRAIACLALLASAVLLSACTVREARLSKSDLERFRAYGNVKSVRRVPPAFAVHSPWEATLPVAGAAAWVALPYVGEATSRLNLLESAGEAVGEGGKAAFGLFSAEGAVAYATARRRGKILVAPFRLDDPAQTIRENFSYTLSSTGPGMAGSIAEQAEPLPPPSRRRSSFLSRRTDPKELEALKAKVGDGFVLDFRTTDWGLLYYTWDWDRYRLRYAATARLLDFTGPGAPKVAWEGRCEVLEDEFAKRPFLRDYVDDNAALLRIRLLDAAEDCSRQLWRKFAAGP